MSVLLLNEQELCGYNTFMAKNIGRLHQNLHDFRPPPPCPAFGGISRGIQRTELVRAKPELSKPSSLCFQTQTSRFLCIFLKFMVTTAATGASEFTIMSGHQRLPSLHAEKESEMGEAQPASWRAKMEATEKYLSAWNSQPFPQNVQQTDLSAMISFHLQFIFPVFSHFFCLSVSITYHQPQSEDIK